MITNRYQKYFNTSFTLTLNFFIKNLGMNLVVSESKINIRIEKIIHCLDQTKNTIDKQHKSKKASCLNLSFIIQ
ncbi:hypothetical protein GCM10022258_30970 [Aquimarina gracilis]